MTYSHTQHLISKASRNYFKTKMEKRSFRRQNLFYCILLLQWKFLLQFYIILSNHKIVAVFGPQSLTDLPDLSFPLFLSFFPLLPSYPSDKVKLSRNFVNTSLRPMLSSLYSPTIFLYYTHDIHHILLSMVTLPQYVI